jgi:hypothetical protein
MRQKRQQALAELNPPVPTVSLEDLPAAGQRWKRNPDGSWMRWSYLGEEWEPADAPQVLLDAAQLNLAENEWTRDPDGTWRPATAECEANAREAELAEPPAPLPPPKPIPEDAPRPEWTAEWHPEWKEPFK